MTPVRVAVWVAFLLAAVVRPLVDTVDRALVARCWNIPSAWNAVADAAIRAGAVDARIEGRPALWRQASVLPLGLSRVAAVTVSDMRTSRVAFVNERYGVMGLLARHTADPALVTDEMRGYKPLSHIWPIVEQEGRLLTLIAMAPLRSDPVRFGAFAYVALGTRENEVLFVCRLDSAPGPTWGELVRLDVNGDGVDDLAVFERGQRNDPPIAVFLLDPRTRVYTARATPQGRRLVAWWAWSPGDRVIVRRDVPIDDPVRRIAERFPASQR